MSVHGLFMLLLASSGPAAAIVVGPLLAHRVDWRAAAAGLKSGVKQKSSHPVQTAAFDP